MNDDLEIPLLEDLIVNGQADSNEEQSRLNFNDQSELEIESDENDITDDKQDELSSDASIRELIIDEEIRMILDKHMDNAYEEIIRLLNHRIS